MGEGGKIQPVGEFLGQAVAQKPFDSLFMAEFVLEERVVGGSIFVHGTKVAKKDFKHTGFTECQGT